MKTIKISEIGNRPIFQGDIMLKAQPIGSLGGKQLDTTIIAHSETGHHHTAENALVFGVDPMTMFLRPDGKGFIDGVPYVDIVHHRPTDTHETFRLFFDVPNVEIKIKRQRERTPEGWRRVED